MPKNISGGKAGDPAPFLTSWALADLHGSGINDDTIREAALFSVIDAARAGRLLNWKGPAKAIVPCLAFPYAHANGYVRLKPEHPRSDENGKAAKYESPVGQPNRCYFPPGVRELFADPSVPLLITEGEKKSLKATQEGYPCIGLVGVDGWSVKRTEAQKKANAPRMLIPDLATIAWKGRRVTIIFDSDAAEKEDVRRAECSLSEALRAAGADVGVVRLPPGEEVAT
jgi:putative DNA primase/helicase